VVVIVFENKPASAVLGTPAAPTFNRLARRYATLRNYFAVAHPSLPNYLALVSGSTQGITNDCNDCTVAGHNIADTLEDAGESWKTYAEDLPQPGYTGADAGRYAKRHNPLLYFRDVLARPSRLRRIVTLSQFGHDLGAGVLPDFSLVVPNVCHDMHDCPVATGDAWLHRFLRPLLGSSALGEGVVFVVFDEDDGEHGNRVAALALGPLVRPGSRSRQRLNHYALLRTIEDRLGLPRLGRSASAPPISGIWRST
jgi:phospholipase C